MKIARIVVDRLELPLDPPFVASWDPVPRTTLAATIVHVHTDDGHVGIGGGDHLHGVVEHLPVLVGTDPLRIELQVRRLETIDQHAGRPWPVEAALWDLIGLVYDQPVWRLFGGVADRLPAYASLGARRDTEELADVARDLRDDGFGACKLRVDAHSPGTAIPQVQAVRDAVGPAMALMVDLNQAWRMTGDTAPSIDLRTAQRFADAFAEAEVTWLEEPLAATDHDGLAALRARSRVRIAGGEFTRTFDQLLADVATDRYDVHQADVVLSGMWRGRTIAELALRRGRWYTPHTWNDGIGLLANLHVCAGVGGGPFLEYPCDPAGWTPPRRDFMLAAPTPVADGMVIAPDAPGLGVVLDADEVDRRRVARSVVTADGVTHGA